MNSMWLEKWNRTMTPGSITGTISAWNESWTHAGDFAAMFESQAFATVPNLFSDRATMEGNALVKAMAKVNSPDIMSTETLATLGQTVGMLRHPFRSSTDLLKKILKRRDRKLLKSGSNLVRANADAWLEYRYGWKPIILDAETVIEKAHSVRSSLGRRLVVRASECNEGTFSRAYTELANDSFDWGFRSSGTVTANQSVKCHAGIIVDVVNQTTQQNLEKLLGLRARDLPSLAWELIPYSFVVDWFANVGDWIQAVVPNPAVTVKGQWVTSVMKRTVTLSGTCSRYFYWASPYPRLNGSLGSSTYNYTIVSREANPGLPPTPSLTFKPLSVTHAADALSLLVRPIQESLRGFKH